MVVMRKRPLRPGRASLPGGERLPQNPNWRPQCSRNRLSPPRVHASRTENFLDGLQRKGQVMRVARERKKPVLPVECGGLVVDGFHLDRPEGDFASDAESAVKSIQKEELAEPLAALGL